MEVMAPPAPAGRRKRKSSVSEVLFFKNRLQEYTQRATLPLPIYETINEGSVHEPKFRSTVTVNGVKHQSCNTFLRIKEAEQDAAKLALESILNIVTVEGVPPICEDTQFCKSILHEYADKRKIQLPAYTTTSKGIFSFFISSIVFDEKTYIGSPGKNKKEAEQLAARAAIQSILGDSSSGTSMLEIIQSKSKWYASLKMVDLNTEAIVVPVTTSGNTVNGLSAARVESDFTLDKLPANQELVPAIPSASQNVAQAAISQLAEQVLNEKQSICLDKPAANQELIFAIPPASQNVAQAAVSQLAEQVPKEEQSICLDTNGGNTTMPNQSLRSLQVEPLGDQNVEMETKHVHLKMAGDNMQDACLVSCSASGHVGTSGVKKRKHKKNKRGRRAKKPKKGQVPKEEQSICLVTNGGYTTMPDQSLLRSLQVESLGDQNVEMETNPAHLKMAGDNMQAACLVSCSASGHVGASGVKKRKHKKNKRGRRAKKRHT